MPYGSRADETRHDGGFGPDGASSGELVVEKVSADGSEETH